MKTNFFAPFLCVLSIMVSGEEELDCPELMVVTELSTHDAVIKTSNSDLPVGPGDMFVWDENPVCAGTSRECNATTAVGKAQGYCIGLPNGNMNCLEDVIFPYGTISTQMADATLLGKMDGYAVILGGTGCFASSHGTAKFTFNEDDSSYTYDFTTVHLGIENAPVSASEKGGLRKAL